MHHYPPTSESFTPVSRKSVRPHHISESLETSVLPKIMPELPDIESTFDRDAIPTGVQIPEVMPVLLSLRSRRAARRIAHTQAKIEQLADDQSVAKFVAHSITKGKGYLKSGEPLRPKTLKQRGAAYVLDTTMNSRRGLQRIANSISDPYLVAREGSSEGVRTVKREFRQEDKKLSGPERKNNAKNEWHHTKLAKRIRRRDKLFAYMVRRPHRRAERLIRKRDKLVLLHKGIENARTS